MKCFQGMVLTVILFLIACQPAIQKSIAGSDGKFSSFETRFLDQYWKQYPANAIAVGYGKYYDELSIPDSSSFDVHIRFSRDWLDSLQQLDTSGLSNNNKISLNIIENQLQSDIWYASVFRPQEWDASSYNLSNECYYIINQPWASLDDRLRTLSKHLVRADEYYKEGFNRLKRPTRESVALAIVQNKGGLSIFGKELSDSIRISDLSAAEIDTLKKNIEKTVGAMTLYMRALEKIMGDKNYIFRKFSIGKKLFADKFRYDLATNFSPEELYAKASAEKTIITERMARTADSLWIKYFPGKPKPQNSRDKIQAVVDTVSLQHAKAADFFDSLKNQVYALKKFIIAKDLFAFDSSFPIIVRLMPEYERGVTLASAEFTPPYQKKGDTYYNIDDLTKYSKEKQESTLREMNNYMSQLISIHEAVPGHCVQGIYNNLKSPDVLRSVFQNGAMVEGWAVYSETMMVENGWGNHAPEMQLIHDKLKLRELGNVLIDYQLQCLDSSAQAIKHLLVTELFQTPAQAAEKYNRATLSQVQLCSYYAGSSAIFSLREEYRAKKGSAYNLKDFHEQFLQYGSSPVKYIRERMLN